MNTKSCLYCLSLISMWMVRTMSTWNLREYENNIRMAPFDSMRHRPHGRLACSTRAILITDRTATPPGTESLALLRATRSETPHTHTRSHTSHHDYTTARALHIAFVQAVYQTHVNASSSNSTRRARATRTCPSTRVPHRAPSQTGSRSRRKSQGHAPMTRARARSTLLGLVEHTTLTSTRCGL